MSAKKKMILVPTDFSETSDRGLDAAIEYAALLGGRVVLAHVEETPAYFGFDAIAIPAEEKGLTQRIDRALATRAERARAKGIEVEQVRLEGAAWEALTQYARRHAASLIVMGTHGRTGIKHAFIGSVAERVIPRAPCPVMVVPPVVPPAEKGEENEE